MGPMVSCPAPSSVPDVLDGASGVFDLAVCGTLRGSRPPHCLESARAAIRGYHDELHVLECGLVVFLDANPTLSDLSAAFLDCAAVWALHLPIGGMRDWIFRALLIINCLSSGWIVAA